MCSSVTVCRNIFSLLGTKIPKMGHGLFNPLDPLEVILSTPDPYDQLPNVTNGLVYILSSAGP